MGYPVNSFIAVWKADVLLGSPNNMAKNWKYPSIVQKSCFLNILN